MEIYVKKNYVLSALMLILSLSACENTDEPMEQNYTVPSWSLYIQALRAGHTANNALSLLIPKDYPYNINTTINGNPSTQIGIAWFTNANETESVVQIAEGKIDKFTILVKTRQIPAISVAVDDLNYVSAGTEFINNNEQLMAVTGFSAGEKRSYTSNKALVDHLKPSAVYSYRVGKKNTWSEVGTFTTADINKESFEFIYITDTQANTDDMFDVSKKTIETAYLQVPEAKFLLITGDLVESANEQSSEWEWEQWFEKTQHVWMHLPIVPAQGNHDVSPFGNLFHHFNSDNTYNMQQTSEEAKTSMGGAVYAFVYGDALFMILNYEDYGKGEHYFSALEKWMRKQVSEQLGIKWKIVAFHKTMFTGSTAHQDDFDGRIVRERMAPVFQELNIDLVLQGHDHVYEVIGVLTAQTTETGVVYSHLSEAVADQKTVEPTLTDGTVDSNPSISVAGKEGGIYNVTNGTLYFLNNSAGKKKYYPRSKIQMEAAFQKHNVENYFEMFNKFGQTGEPTFSRIKVSTESIEINTYTVDDSGNTKPFDSFRIIKF